MGDPTYDNAAALDAEGIPSLDEVPSDDEGMIPPGDSPRAALSYGTTAEEERHRETLEQRLAQEIPEVTEDDIDERHAESDPLLDTLAAGQLLRPGDADVDLEEAEAAMVAAQGAGGAPQSGIALSAEEEAVHITDAP